MATITDVARAAGVAVSTVSYALSGARPIRPETKERIEAAMRDLGYQPNAMARSLASRRTGILAMVYPEVESGVGSTGGEFIHAAGDRARELGYHLVLWPFRSDDTEQVRDLVRQSMADGVLIMGVRLDDPRIDLLESDEVPYTMIGRTRDVSQRRSVDIDFDATVEAAVDRLVELGHRQIAFINHSSEFLALGHGPTVRAAEAFARHVGQHGMEPLVRQCDDSPLAGQAAAAELLTAHPGLTAFITMNELATFGVLGEVRDRGLTVPDDVSVLGIVTSPGVGALTSPTLSTMDAPTADLARLAVDQLVAQLDADRPSPPNRLLPCRFGRGATLAPAPHH